VVTSPQWHVKKAFPKSVVTLKDYDAEISHRWQTVARLPTLFSIKTFVDDSSNEEAIQGGSHKHYWQPKSDNVSTVLCIFTFIQIMLE